MKSIFRLISFLTVLVFIHISCERVLELEAANDISFGKAGTKSDIQTVFINDKDTLYAYDPGSDTKKWSFLRGRPSDQRWFSPIIINNTLYTGGNKLYALKLTTGELEWELPFPVGGISSVNDNVIYAVYDNAIKAIDITNKNTLWNLGLSQWTWTSNPVIENHMVYVLGSPDIISVDRRTGILIKSLGINHLYAIDAKSGKVKWEFITNASLYHSSLAVVDGTVYIGGEKFNALDAETGATKWALSLGNGTISSSPAVGKDMVYIGYNGYLYAIDSKKGNKVWEAEVGLPYQLISSDGVSTRGEEQPRRIYGDGTYSPIVSEGVVYVNGKGGLYAFNATTGSLKWVTDLKGETIEGPVVAGNTAVISAFDENNLRRISFIDTDNGKTMKVLEIKTPIGGYVPGGLCVLLKNGTVAYQGKSGSQK